MKIRDGQRFSATSLLRQMKKVRLDADAFLHRLAEAQARREGRAQLPSGSGDPWIPEALRPPLV